MRRSTSGSLELVGLRAQAVARLGVTGSESGHLAQVLDEQQVAKMLEQVGDEAREILALVGELLDEGEQAGGVLVHDEVAEAEQRLFLDGAEELEDRPAP